MIRYPATGLARIAAFVFLACGTALAQTGPDDAASAGVSVKLTTVVMALPAGTPWLTVNAGLLCVRPAGIRSASGGRDAQDLPPYTAAFKTEMEKAGLKTTADDDLFNREDIKAADYQVAAVITDEHILACTIMEQTLGFSLGDTRGDGMMKIDWQVYSPLKKEVVARISTSGSVKLADRVPDGMARLVTEAFASNARALVSDPAFRVAISAKPPTPQDVLLNEKQSMIGLLGSSKAAKRPIADEVGSVVTLMTGAGSGSGVLLSGDGYVLTNAHVVGDEKEVRVRWSDGIEKTGQVIRVSKPRDVALIKTDPRDREPLSILRGALNPGQRVFAIGSPRGKDFQGTVSSGVVSASRTIEGMRYIQSDVSVSPGSSGGALLDENGSLLGITEAGFQNQGQNAGLNIFIPIGDAMDFLSLEQD
jgi:S1-C subfamily serine protease